MQSTGVCLTAQESALHARPVVEATLPDFGMLANQFECLLDFVAKAIGGIRIIPADADGDFPEVIQEK